MFSPGFQGSTAVLLKIGRILMCYGCHTKIFNLLISIEIETFLYEKYTFLFHFQNQLFRYVYNLWPRSNYYPFIQFIKKYPHDYLLIILCKEMNRLVFFFNSYIELTFSSIVSINIRHCWCQFGSESFYNQCSIYVLLQNEKSNCFRWSRLFKKQKKYCVVKVKHNLDLVMIKSYVIC